MSELGNFFINLWEKISIPFFGGNMLSNILDILIMALIIYALIVLVRNTRAQQLATGIVLLLLSYALAIALKLRAVEFFLAGVMQFGIVVLAVIFQPELRRALEQVGGMNSTFLRFIQGNRMDEGVRSQWETALIAVCDSAEKMAEERTGALIVLERHTNLNEIIRTGTPVHGDVNMEILGTIFYEGSPLHDGAVVVRDGRIEAAGCFLPLSNNVDISKDMGTRHRAALGMSENSDAIIVVVSEETGVISLAKNAVLIRRLDRQNLFALLISELLPKTDETKKIGFWKKVWQEVRRGKEN